ncbi:mandelate racemase/muconate lactonizing enzyme family protein [Hyphomonas adhaerens MHS-3]|uniref:Dipeptide epimerase n=1 Tax=Hyphomonas adhaerens MHS-3 TaxID=1280949 RepID=A0A069E7Y0_9PROT|nr:mandelate racemase/muconate lactonizing enzyme family protein [Hyphomonas adhaerens MHS-3]
MRVSQKSWPLKQPLKFAFAELHSIDVLTVELDSGAARGRGEGIGVFFHGDNPEKGAIELAAFEKGFGSQVAVEAALGGLKSYAARNALDCALWDLRCKEASTSIHEMIGAPAGTIQTFQTISLDAPGAMAAAAEKVTGPRLKLKVDAPRIVDQVRAVRQVRGDAILMADANQDLSFERLREVAPALAKLNLIMLEQPLTAGEDADLAGFQSPIPLCADESCFTVSALEGLAGLYDAVNIKLDKTGGLTGALALLAEARRLGFDVLVGCMAGTSLSMAPALALATMCDFADLDGPLLLADDYDNAARYVDGTVYPPPKEFWG